MEYRELKTDNLAEASSLIWIVFSQYVAPGYSQEGIDTFRKFIQPKELKILLEGGRFFISGCFDGEELVGVIAMRDHSHISLLFVNKAYHGRGIAKALFSEALKKCVQKKSEIGEISVNSSPYAVEIYKKLGFEVTGQQTTKDGITFVPMKMMVSL
ncbi:Histone acetyltransferase HPA2 and acetyltransferase [Dehalobacter sp. UNSWDHB]|jgi:Acetyltransferases|uniref:GNAT family N-acetyltransferase n=1 Tax=unclassified Dehalobacter TaxID=2635733 RepID=UPI00028B8D9B|nr:MULTISPECIES: GNAT family N-acetyltransferase [unclassified Dehalobacter]AFV01520.1 Histone acetyltransferase HPA2-related acetyltransferase [Dehalobacter sp. DCA]AFV04554.1 Histone acetyltransferase HPA2-related acetyltransferase [Dehalobacter sp. CF]EQB21226.1 Histone acetyltransferase HPA2 and acetyltransferase [Dehalobacter sp. UNSWDHB]